MRRFLVALCGTMLGIAAATPSSAQVAVAGEASGNRITIIDLTDLDNPFVRGTVMTSLNGIS